MQIYKSAKKGTIESMANLLQEIDPHIEPFTETKSSLSKASLYQEFFNSHLMHPREDMHSIHDAFK